MKINERLKHAIMWYSVPFQAFTSSRTNDIHNFRLNLMYLKIFKEGDYYIIPSMLMHLMYNTTFEHKDNNLELAVPLSLCRECNYKSVDSILTNIISHRYSRDSELLKITSDKYGTYYGNKGMVLYSLNFIRRCLIKGLQIIVCAPV